MSSVSPPLEGARVPASGARTEALSVSVVATVRNERATIAAFVDSLIRQTRSPEEIVIVDGKSTDGTTEILEHYAAEHGIIVISTRCNIAEGRNIGVRSARGDVIAVTDAGCRVDAGVAGAHPRLLRPGRRCRRRRRKLQVRHVLTLRGGGRQGDLRSRPRGARGRPVLPVEPLGRLPQVGVGTRRRLPRMAVRRRGYALQRPPPSDRLQVRVQPRRDRPLAAAGDAARAGKAAVQLRARQRARRDRDRGIRDQLAVPRRDSRSAGSRAVLPARSARRRSRRRTARQKPPLGAGARGDRRPRRPPGVLARARRNGVRAARQHGRLPCRSLGPDPRPVLRVEPARLHGRDVRRRGRVGRGCAQLARRGNRDPPCRSRGGSLRSAAGCCPTASRSSARAIAALALAAGVGGWVLAGDSVWRGWEIALSIALVGPRS